MAYVEDWYNSLQAKTDRRKVFVATDEPEVLQELQSLYGDRYNFMWVNYQGRISGAGDRYGEIPTAVLFAEISFMARANFTVGTCSSQVSRLVYELMPQYGMEKHMWSHFISLDSPWYFP